MKRICLLGAAIAGLLIIGVATAPAAAPHASTNAAGKKTTVKSNTVTTKLKCTSNLSLQVPNGETTVTQGATDGTQYGAVKCPGTLGSGVQFETFTTDDAGNVSGKWQQYFKAGTVYGDYTLVPNDNNPPTTTSFTAASYAGTLTIKNGTGADAKATGTGTLTCSTTDSVHFACTDKAKLMLPAATTTG